ncbi:MAG: EAL domain-containing protein [Candidatus Thiodiazotropha sp. (ex Dulcina madagascariensis)]|nr:EAL domain-containing protein [Candidatus Thiodiazotropha sp. (ex Dulcina madagascariensis)]
MTSHNVVKPAHPTVNPPRSLFLNSFKKGLILAIIYVLTAKLGQTLAIPPGNVTAVWIPSGIILAAIFVWGYRVWPGIFLGAFIGNTTSYISLDSWQAILNAFSAGILNGIGDVLCAVVGAYMIERACQTRFPFRQTSHVFNFVLYGALIGSLISALFGVTGLAVSGFITWDSYLDVFVTWWTGDGVGVLIITPVLLSLINRHESTPFTLEHLAYAVTLCIGIAFGLGLITPIAGHSGLFVLMPIVMWSVFRLDIRTTFASIFMISAAVTIATAMGESWIAASTLNDSLIELQQYMSVLALTFLVLQAITEERKLAQTTLHELNHELDNRVAAKTEDLEKTRKNLEESDRRLRGLVNSMEAGVIVHNPDTSIAFVNPKAASLLGLDESVLRGKSAADPAWHFIDEQHAPLGIENYPVNKVLRSRSLLRNMVAGIVKPSNQISWMLVNGVPTFDEAGSIKEILISFVDITEIKEAQFSLNQAATVFQNTIEGVTITDADGNILDVNPAFTEITGYSRDEVIGKNPRFLQSGKHDKDYYQAMWRSLTADGYWRGEIWNQRKDGIIYPELLTISAVHDEQGNTNAYIGVFNDIALIKKSEEQLDYLAHHDPLTGLPNRLLFTSHLRQSVKFAKRHKSATAVVFIDLDQFKSINDSLGHQIGDELLKSIATRLTSVVRENDVVAHISGDEFVVLLEDLQEEDHVIIAINRIMSAFDQVFTIGENLLHVTASLGVSLLPQDARDASELMKHADAAMYQAKEEGRNNYRFFTPDINDSVLEHALLGSALSMALENSEFNLVYQPQVDLDTGRIVGLEALLRWRHPQLGAISPERFIPIAEQSGLMRKIGNFVLETACKQGKRWLNAGLDFGRIAVNVSGRQFQGGEYISDLERILQQTDFSPTHLEIELTESILMKRTEENIALLKQIADKGIQIAIDDFGTGYSSLSYLSKLPIDKLKVDKEFIHDILIDEHDAALAASIIALGEALHIVVVAEGVEFEAQSQFLSSHNCMLAQGYLFGKPVPAEEMSEYLRNNQYSLLQNSTLP